MIQVSNIQMPLDFGIDNDPGELMGPVSKMLGIPAEAISNIEMIRRAVDARRKSNVHFVVTARVSLDNSFDESEVVSSCGSAKIVQPFENPLEEISNTACVHDGTGIEGREPAFGDGRPVVVGSGPAGLFSALALARAGLNPIVLERGGNVAERASAISSFENDGKLDPNTNVQFGEGGAGLYSDGKLATGISDPYVRFVLQTFVENGAPEEILWQAHPHIGTDLLPKIIENMRHSIESLGAEFMFNSKLCAISVEQNRLAQIEVERSDGGKFELAPSALVLAIGHSARDTYEMLKASGIEMQRKPFAVGARIEHRQSQIDRAQYGKFAGHPALGAAEYKLSCHLKSGRSVYSFCMCPGGEVVAAASEPNRLVVNGMSRHARDGANAHSALLVTVTPGDFSGTDPLAGVEFQRKLESRAFELGGSSYRAPAQMVGDFLAGRASTSFGDVHPTYPLGVTPANLDELLPKFVGKSIREAIPIFGRKIRGFDEPEAVLTGIESRSSSPVRILRDETRQSNILGIYPAGEGAGYAGGITSSAVDGLRTAIEVILHK
ncbi:MAG: NAD(P)/FAD-dependent oxidoreductase [Coriobacteriales bacterium]|jgi:uncharacterized FAD-dependent dehydrogenase